ncbi:MAG: hypothetical protein JWN73_4855 [Betaproteobacteria bacterium]|nr:hypothetical protein [Betaproteobacteria bacterium]
MASGNFVKRLLLAALVAVSFGVRAQEFPNRPVRLIVTFTPGGAADVTARLFADKLGAVWKQGVIVDNKPGAGGSIGADFVFHAPADGYTLLLATNTHIINHVLIPKLGFDYTKDFTPLGLVTSGPMLIATNPSLPVSNLKELTQLLKSAPGKYSYATCNVASPHHFAMEIYKHTMKIEATHIPYRGCTPAVTDTLAGQVKIVSASIPAVAPFAQRGSLKAIALWSSKRSALMPTVPTVAESGIAELKDFSLDNYYGFMGPGGLPPKIARKLEDDIRKVALDPDTMTRLQAAGLELFALDPAQMMILIRADAVKYATAAKQANIKLD